MVQINPYDNTNVTIDSRGLGEGYLRKALDAAFDRVSTQNVAKGASAQKFKGMSRDEAKSNVI